MPHSKLLNCILSHFVAVGLVLLFGFLAGSSSMGQEAVAPLKVLLITGGCCHDYDAQKQLIKNGLEQRAHMLVTVVQQGGTATDSRIPLYENADWATGYDVVIHDECFSDVKDNAWTRRILKPHREGLPAVVVHCAMHCYRDGTDDWFEFCGVTSRTHGAHYPHEVLNRDAEHPIMQGFGAGWANPAGELYWIEKVWPSTHPLASSKNQEKGNEEVCVWTNDYHGTRVFGTTLGHHNETVSHPAFLELLTRGTLWACNRLDDGRYLKNVDPRNDSEAAEPPPVAGDRKKAIVPDDVQVPEEFAATLFAAPPAVQYPVFVAADDNGVLYVSVDKNGSLDRKPNRGAIFRLRDIDGDGYADETKLYVSNVDSPRGLVWDRDRLYVLHPPHLSAFIDHDGDGISDEQQLLVENLAFTFKDRPADHSSNGVTLGIDGWLYLAIGDFGFMDAVGRDGRHLQFRGGGVVRVRPDGTELEVYSRGTRNILEVALDPQLNGFARDNTNDGGGWDIRLHHFSGLENHGYPTRFKNFADEIVQPLADYGGGSGCGACYIAEGTLPAEYSDRLYTADWGRDYVYRHGVTRKGATFDADQTPFVRVPRVTDLDVDGNGRIYVSSWKGATFTYAGEEVGYVLQLTPKSTASRTIIDWSRLDEQQLMQFLTGDSHRRRLAAQRELLARPRTDNTLDKIVGIARDPGQPKEVRTAAIFAVSQKRSDSRLLISLGDDDQIKPMVLRALSEMKIEAPQAASGSLFEGTATGQPHPSILVEGFCGESLDDPQARTRLEAIRAIHRLKSRTYEPKIVERLVDDDPVVAHTAMNALVDLKWWQLCFSEWQQTVDSPGVSNLDEAIYRRTWQQIADPELVRLVLEDFSDPLCTVHRELFAALCRLHFVEGTWTGVSWGTRPDTRGPYYQPETWEASAEILPAIIRYISAVDPEQFSDAIEMLIRHRFEQPEVGTALRERAEADGRCLAGLLKWYDRDVSVDEKLKNLLERTLNENTHDSNHLAMAIRLLWRCDAPPASDVLSALDRLRQVDSGAFSETWRQLRQPNLTRKHLRLLADQLHSSDRSHQVMALSLLLGLDGGDRQSRGRRRQGDDDAKELLMEAWEGLVAAKEWVSAIELSDDRSQEPRIWQLASSEDAEVATAARELAARWGLKELTPGSGPKIKEVGADAALSQLGTEGMGVELGQRWFARLSCTNCHTVSQDEPARGPYLPNVAKTYRRDQLAESLLKPSKSLAQGFATETFSLADGRQITGFVATQSAVRLAVRDGQGKEYIFSPEEIEERTPQPTSVMPEGLVDELSIDDVNALLDYLQSLGR